MNSQYDVYMCRSIDKRKETERQLADAELLRSIIDEKALKIKSSGWVVPTAKIEWVAKAFPRKENNEGA